MGARSTKQQTTEVCSPATPAGLVLSFNHQDITHQCAFSASSGEGLVKTRPLLMVLVHWKICEFSTIKRHGDALADPRGGCGLLRMPGQGVLQRSAGHLAALGSCAQRCGSGHRPLPVLDLPAGHRHHPHICAQVLAGTHPEQAVGNSLPEACLGAIDSWHARTPPHPCVRRKLSYQGWDLQETVIGGSH